MRSLLDLYLSRRDVQPNTMKGLESTLHYFADWWDEKGYPPSELTFDDVEDYIYSADGLRRNRRAGSTGDVIASTFNMKLSDLRSFIDWSDRRHHFKGEDIMNAFDKTKKTVHETPKVRLSMAQLDDAVNGCATPWERWVVAFAFLSLGREGELLRVQLGDVDLTIGLVDWGRPKVKDFTDKLPMLEQFEDEYLRWRKHYLAACPEIAEDDYAGNSFAIPTRTVNGHHRVTRYYPNQSPATIGHIVKNASARALGVRPSTLVGQAAHIARRSGARVLFDQLRDDNVPDPIRIVQAMLGHKHQQTTEIYIGLEADRERRNKLIAGGKYMKFADTNVVQLREVK